MVPTSCVDGSATAAFVGRRPDASLENLIKVRTSRRVDRGTRLATAPRRDLGVGSARRVRLFDDSSHRETRWHTQQLVPRDDEPRAPDMRDRWGFTDAPPVVEAVVLESEEEASSPSGGSRCWATSAARRHRMRFDTAFRPPLGHGTPGEPVNMTITRRPAPPESRSTRPRRGATRGPIEPSIGRNRTADRLNEAYDTMEIDRIFVGR